MKKSHLHIIQSTHLLEHVSFVESNSVKQFFHVTKSDFINPKADLLFCQTYTNSRILKSLEATDIPCVIHVQGDVWYELNEIYNRKKLLKRIDRVLKRAKKVVCISRFLANIAKQRLGTNNIIYLPGGLWGTDHTISGIIPQRFNQKQDFNADNPKVIMQISLTLPKKYAGIPVFFEAIHDISNVNFVCVGNKKNRKDLIKMWENKYNLKFMSSVDYWPDLLSEADIYAHPSLYDTWGRSVAEAMCTGLPVFAFHFGGVPEVSKNLHFCDPENANEIRNRFFYLLENPDEAKLLGKRLYDEAFEKTELHRHDYADILKSCLNS